MRRRHRQARTCPLLDELHSWLTSMGRRAVAELGLDKAIGCKIIRRKALTRYRNYRRLEINNTAAERAQSGIALGRNRAT